MKNTQENVEYKTPLHVNKDTEPKSIGEKSKPMEEQATKSQHTEIIPALPTSKIVLKVTEIPPFDVFYSPLHKAIVRRQRRRKRVDTPEFPPRNKLMGVVWKDIHFNPAENLTRLSQFIVGYASAIMDKATEVSTLLRKNEKRISQLEQQLEAKKASVNSQAAEHLTQLQRDMEVLKISHEADISAKNMQLQ